VTQGGGKTKGWPVAGALVWLGQCLRCRARDGTGRGSSRDARDLGLHFYRAHVEGAVGTAACRGRETTVASDGILKLVAGL
jgi:hypothetical protein